MCACGMSCRFDLSTVNVFCQQTGAYVWRVCVEACAVMPMTHCSGSACHLWMGRGGDAAMSHAGN